MDALQTIVIIAGKPLEPQHFFFFEAGCYEMGIDEKCIPTTFTHPYIKTTYLLASTPKHRRFMPSCAISKFFITVEEFSRFVETTGYITDAEKEGWGWILRDGKWQKINGINWKTPFGNDADKIYQNFSHIMPVLQVSWNDAHQYCLWLSQLTKKKISLPSEILWENFATIFKAPSICEMIKYMLPHENIEYKTNEEYLLHIKGQIDSYGNAQLGILWEWCNDWYDSYNGMQKNKDFGTVYKVLRGGSLLSYAIQRTKEYRFRRCPTARSPYYSFRISIEI